MPRAQRSGISVYAADVPIILGMVARGDRRHDIAAWFGLNQGRIAEVEEGRHGPLVAAPESQLPPSGSPGIKATALRQAIGQVRKALQDGDINRATQIVEEAIVSFDRNE